MYLCTLVVHTHTPTHSKNFPEEERFDMGFDELE